MKLYNFYLLAFISIFTINLSAQDLPIIKAEGGQGRNINWASIKVKENAEEGPGFFYNDCAQGVTATKASSTLVAQGTKSYSISNLTDNDPMTAWVEGVVGYGIGESFEIESPGVNEIYNGYQSSPTGWLNNSRVKRFKVYVNGKPNCFLDLMDEMGRQIFDLGVPAPENGEKNNFKFEIVDVYKGLKYDDVCISHIDYTLCCFAANTMLLSLDGTSIEADSISVGSTIMGYDMNGAKSFQTSVEWSATQQHATLIKIVADNKVIEVTPDHPLFIKDQGFISMQALSAKTSGKSYDEIAGNYEIMLWDEQKGATFFATVQSIEILHGNFQTVTVRHISSGQFYIANGFISKTY